MIRSPAVAVVADNHDVVDYMVFAAAALVAAADSDIEDQVEMDVTSAKIGSQLDHKLSY